MAFISQVLSEKKVFKIVGRWTTDHGYPISSPGEPFLFWMSRNVEICISCKKKVYERKVVFGERKIFIGKELTFYNITTST